MFSGLFFFCTLEKEKPIILDMDYFLRCANLLQYISSTYNTYSQYFLLNLYFLNKKKQGITRITTFIAKWKIHKEIKRKNFKNKLYFFLYLWNSICPRASASNFFCFLPAHIRNSAKYAPFYQHVNVLFIMFCLYREIIFE